jgi:hypothetical protein
MKKTYHKKADVEKYVKNKFGCGSFLFVWSLSRLRIKNQIRTELEPRGLSWRSTVVST